jgi:CDP-glycerol:poly(glycerophosphate) glycerophosphotransferase
MPMKQVNYRRGPRTRSSLWLVKAIGRRLLMIAMGILDRLISKRSRRVVLGSDKGLKYNGNPCFLFEFLAQSEGWDPYWLTESPAIRRQINDRFPGRALHAWSPRALLMGLSAQWLGFSHSRYDLGPFAYLKRPRFIYLNHGVPLKTMGFDKAYHDPATAGAAAGMGAVTCCSHFEASLWARAFGLPLERIWVTGAPRNDQLFKRNELVVEKLGVRPGQKVVLFAPTYRETGLLPNYLPTPDLDAHKLVQVLEKFDAVLLIRPHYYEWAAARAMVEGIGSPHLRTADEGLIEEINQLLPFVDVLVTDYSSIYFDYLLLDRPMIFACFDQEAYARERGFSIDYDSNTPGQKVTNGEEFLAALESLLAGDDPHSGFRAEVRARFHEHVDANSAARVAARIELPLHRLAPPEKRIQRSA